MWHLNNDPYLECPWFGHLVPEEILPFMAKAKKRFNKKLPIRFNIDEGWEGIQ